MDAEATLLRFSLDTVPEAERLDTLQEVFGNGYANINFIPLTEKPNLEVETRMLPGVSITRGFCTPYHLTFNQDASRTNDDFTLVAGHSPKKGRARHHGRELESGDGSAFLISCAEPSVAETQSEFWPCSVTISRSLLLPSLPEAEDRLMRLIPAENPALRLLNAYLHALNGDERIQSPELAYAVATHIRDLVVLALGSGRDAEAVAIRGGLRAARLATIKQWIFARLTDPALCVGEAATAQGVSERYVQMLFEDEGTTFSAFVLAKRLELARSYLTDRRVAGRSIGTIAYDCGFNDLSYFNRAFRTAFQQAPSDVRHHPSGLPT